MRKVTKVKHPETDHSLRTVSGRRLSVPAVPGALTLLAIMAGTFAIAATANDGATAAVLKSPAEHRAPSSSQPASRVIRPMRDWPEHKVLTEVPPEIPEGAPMLPEALANRAVSAPADVTFGPYTSVQVNINAAGNNTVNDAANEPSIAVDLLDPNRVVITWRQFDTITNNFRQAGNGYSTDWGQTWNFHPIVDAGQFRSDPVLGSDRFGNIFFSSLSTVTTVEMFRTSDGGVTWQGPANAFGGDKQWIAVDERTSGTGAGYIYQIWNVQFSCCPPDDFTRSINQGVSFPATYQIPLPSMKWGTLDTDTEGTLYLAGSTLGGSGHLFSRSLDAKDPVTGPTFDFVNGINLGGLTGGFGGYSGPNPQGLLGQVWVATDPTKVGRVFVLGSVMPPTSDPLDIMFIRSVDGGESWSDPVRVNDDPAGTNAWQWFGTMSVAPNGRIDVIFNDTRFTGLFNWSALFYTYSLDAGQTWSTNIQVSPTFDSHVGWPSQDKIGDYYDMVSDNGGANIAYSATFNGEEDVYFLRIPQDCNGNGIDDDCDIQCGAAGTRCAVAGCGTNADCNNNWIPDECEPDEDCNGNTQRDICEIGADPSLDCNENDVLDECESAEDCNNNTILDICELADGSAKDCNDNDIPDDCDIDGPVSDDDNGNGVPDECEGACCSCLGCEETTPADCSGLSGEFSGLSVMCDDPGACTPPIPFAHDDCDSALALPSNPDVVVPIDNTCATTDGPDTVPCPGTQPFGTDLWFTYEAPCTGTVTISMCNGTDFDAIMAVYGGDASCTCPTNNLSLIECGDDTCGVGAGPPQVTISVIEGRCYTIRVGGWSSSIGTGELAISYNTFCSPLPPPPEPEPSGFDKNRYISMVIPQTAVAVGSTETAIRVRLTSLHHPSEPADPPDFSQFEGEYRYVNLLRDDQDQPIFNCPDSEAYGTVFRCAKLSCTPEYRDWAGELGGQVLHLTGPGIVPSSRYDVAQLALSCQGSEESCTDVSDELPIFTGQWGDISPGQLDVLDVAEGVDKVKELLGAFIKPRAQLQPNDPDPVANVNVLDVANSVDAVKEKPYPFSGPCPCPSVVTCGAISCDDDSDCAGGLCVGGFCIDACGRCTYAGPFVQAHGNGGCLPPALSRGSAGYPGCGDDAIDLTPGPGTLHVVHRNATYNCCPDDIVIELLAEESTLHLAEREILTTPCDCMCCYDVDATIVGLDPGAYTVEFCWEDYETGIQQCLTEPVVIP